MGNDEPHRLDGFDPDDALEELRSLRREVTAPEAEHGWDYSSDVRRFTELFGLLDHWLIVGNGGPAEWARPEAHLVAEYRMQRQRTTRAQRRG